MINLNAVIVEDELDSQILLSNILTNYCSIIDLKGVASNIEEAQKLIQNNDLDILFLDIELGNQTSFDLLRKMNEYSFEIVFTTAHDSFALEAFKFSATDYVLKPYSPKDILKSVDRIKQKLHEKKLYQTLSHSNGISQQLSNKISVATQSGLFIIDLKDIIKVEGDGAYSKIILKDGSCKTISQSLKELSSRLSSSFYRVHDSHIINLLHLKEFNHGDGGILKLTNNLSAPLSRRKKKDFISTLKML